MERKQRPIVFYQFVQASPLQAYPSVASSAFGFFGRARLQQPPTDFHECPKSGNAVCRETDCICLDAKYTTESHERHCNK